MDPEFENENHIILDELLKELENDSAFDTSMQNSPEGQSARDNDLGPKNTDNTTRMTSSSANNSSLKVHQTNMSLDDSTEMIDDITRSFGRLDSSSSANNPQLKTLGRQVTEKLEKHMERNKGVNEIEADLRKEIDELGIDSTVNSMNNSVHVPNNASYGDSYSASNTDRHFKSNREVTMPVPRLNVANKPIKMESISPNNGFSPCHNNHSSSQPTSTVINSQNTNRLMPNQGNFGPNGFPPMDPNNFNYTCKQRTQYIVEATPIHHNQASNGSDNAGNIPPVAQYKFTKEEPVVQLNGNHMYSAPSSNQHRYPGSNLGPTNPYAKPSFHHQRSRSNELIQLAPMSGSMYHINPVGANGAFGSNLSKSGPIRAGQWKTSHHTPRARTPYGRSRPESPSRITPNLINYENPQALSGHGSTNSVNSMSLMPGGQAAPVHHMELSLDGSLRTSPATTNSMPGSNKKSYKSNKTTRRDNAKDDEERPFRCTKESKKDPTKQCESKFKRADELKRHMKIHNPNKPYKCQYCEMKFSRTDHLTTHTRTHTKEKPYACNYEDCDKRFARSDERLRHHAVHENRKKKEIQKHEERVKKEIQTRQHQQTLMAGQFHPQIPTITRQGPLVPMQTSMTNSGRLTPGYHPMMPAAHNVSLPHSMSNSMNITYPPTPAAGHQSVSIQSPMNSGYVTPNSMPVFGTPHGHVTINSAMPIQGSKSPVHQQNSVGSYQDNQNLQINYGNHL